MGYEGPTESVLSLMRMHKRRGGRSSAYNRGRTSPTPIQTVRVNLPWPLVPYVPFKHSHMLFQVGIVEGGNFLYPTARRWCDSLAMTCILE